MGSLKARAHRAGILYFVFMIVAILGEFVLPNFQVQGDAAATARKIAEGVATYRLAILTGFVTLLVFVFLVSSLYGLFKDVNRGLARLMVLLVVVGVSVALANMILKFVPLVFLRNADALPAFEKPELDALAFAALRLHSAGAILTMCFWGLWLFPFGLLVIRSGFLPKILGFLLLVAGFAYVAGSVTALVLPDHRQAASRVLMPLYFGEVPIIFWLLLMGAKERKSGEPTSGAG
jgi:hypothetical protein